jgi:hypothetical protein
MLPRVQQKKQVAEKGLLLRIINASWHDGLKDFMIWLENRLEKSIYTFFVVESCYIKFI